VRAIKVFHALPLSGFSDDDIAERMAKEDEEIRKLFETADIDVMILHPHMDELKDEVELKQLRHPNLYYFGLSLAEGIAKCDIIAFGHNWRAARGCIVEQFISEMYGIKCVELDKIYSTEKLLSIVKRAIVVDDD
jgi:hypothetical protein